MTRAPCLAALFFTLTPLACGAQPAPPPLVLERTIPLAGVTGRIDHMDVDLARRRLFVAELGNGSVDVIDLLAGASIHRIGALPEPQGVAYAPAADRLAVTNAGDGSVRFFRGEDYAPAGTIGLGADADNIRLDTQTGALVAGYGTGGLAIIDPARPALLRRIGLPAHPEAFVLNPADGRAYVNLPDEASIAVVSLAQGTAGAGWHVPGLGGNFPMALAPSGSVVATVFRSPATLVLLNTASGATIGRLPTCGDADDVFFDAKRDRLYVSCGAGSVDVFEHGAAGYRPVGRVATGTGARTALFVPALDRLFVAVRAGFFGLGRPAAVLVFKPPG